MLGFKGASITIPPTPILPYNEASRFMELRFFRAVPKGPALKTIAGTYYARRRARYVDDDNDEDEEYGHNPDIATFESYSERKRNIALLVRASVDGEEEEVLIFKGFSSLLSSGTAWDPSRSVLPARATIEGIDIVKGPFNPSNIEYLEKGLTLEEFQDRLKQK